MKYWQKNCLILKKINNKDNIIELCSNFASTSDLGKYFMIEKKQKYTVSAPCSLMLFGEHAVLYGKPAIVSAIDKRITVELLTRDDDEVNLHSTLSGSQSLHLQDIVPDLWRSLPKWRFVLASIAFYQKHLPFGFDLKITADYDVPVGLGSSAAVTVATLAVLTLWLDKKGLIQQSLLRHTVQIIREIQGIASGADAAASIYGGVIAYHMPTLKVTKLANTYPLTVIYSGQKIATQNVLEHVSSLQQRHDQVFAHLYAAIATCTHEAKQAWQVADWQAVGELMNIHQGLHDALGVNTQKLAELIFALRRDPKILGAKISGAGMGDCVIGLGKADIKELIETISAKNSQAQLIPVQISSQGVAVIEN